MDCGGGRGQRCSGRKAVTVRFFTFFRCGVSSFFFFFVGIGEERQGSGIC
jgi:hypothetical protein